MGGGVPSGILSQDLTYSGKTKPIQAIVCHFKNAWLNKRVVNTFSENSSNYWVIKEPGDSEEQEIYLHAGHHLHHNIIDP